MAKKRRKTKNKSSAFLRFLLIVAVILIAGTYYIQRQNEIKVETGDQIQVIDVSLWNKRINWNKVKKSGIHYAMLRIGRGESASLRKEQDPYFAGNYKSGRLHNIKMGVYFYSYATTKTAARKEAEYCISLLQKNGIDPKDLALPVAYDVEEKSIFRTGRTNVTEMTEIFCEEIKEAGYTPMVYSSAKSLIRYFKYSVIKNYKIWVAHYGVENSGPAYPYHYDMWQYTSTGIVPGANTSGKDNKGNCDINYYIVD